MEKWKKVSKTSHHTSSGRAEHLAKLLENQAAQLLDVSNKLNESLEGANEAVKDFAKIAFPMVRRVFPSAEELVSVKPMYSHIEQMELPLND